MIVGEFQIRPGYNEVDQMGYVYHANHVTYCHQARTELMREFGIHDAVVEDKGFMMPVISFNIQYKTPARYDEKLTIKTVIKELPKVRFKFFFEIRNAEGKLVSKADSEVVFVDKESRNPLTVPGFVLDKLKSALELSVAPSNN
ncbi:acyl-CoA thioesterase [Plebeiibacterium marinum]|uniref:Acyl-CoA thioesterase n=1 Tax=Plebeiibacterium marinum TaxID=2992111 RepID=A0AAE3MHK3_9BACT|nr:thioesterase family protein [Plebeiobacterium marinum]MCW3807600.1 acyl-CoA thioesterase [Plebeiobacterium marinum]